MVTFAEQSVELPPSKEDSEVLIKSLERVLPLGKLINVEIEHAPDDERHLLITRDIIEKHVPEILPRYDELSKPKVAPAFISADNTESRYLNPRSVHDAFTPFRVNKLADIIESSRQVFRYLRDDESVRVMEELSLAINSDEMRGKLISKEFAARVYDLGNKAVSDYRLVED